MITLYVKSNCQYSAHALAAFDIYNVPFTEKNIADPVAKKELIEIGGKHKVPFMVDGDTKLYESEAIVAYIKEHYGQEADESLHEQVRVFKSSNPDVCAA